IIIGSPILKPEVEADYTNIVIALRNQVKKGMTFKELLFAVRQTCSEAIENQGYPIEILMEELDLPFVDGDFPLFDTAILVENIHEKKHLSSVTPGIIFSFSKTNESIGCGLEYDSCLYEPATAGRFMSHFKRLLEAVLSDVEIKIQALDILSQEEKKKLLYDLNDTATDYPKNRTIPELFREQVARNPHNIALIGPAISNIPDKESGSTIGERISLTYNQLNSETDRLAALLLEKGVGPDTIVGLLAERSIEMIIAIFAILKAGDAYLPIEPRSPEARKLYMLQESRTNLLLATRSLSEEVEKLKNLPLETFFIEETSRRGIFHKSLWEIRVDALRQPLPIHQTQSTVPGPTPPHSGTPPMEGISQGRREPCVRPPTHHEADPTLNSAAGLAYIIYTSGTTGKPKGILTMHYNVIRVVRDTNYIDFKSDDNVLQLSNYAFDGSVFDIYGALLNGAALTMVDEGTVSAVDKLADLIRRGKITVFFVTTALFNALVELKIECFSNVRKVLFGGERVSVEHSKKALEYMGKGSILHVYDPTETTVYATYYPIDHITEKDITVPIGRPIANTSLFVLDKGFHLVPIGVQSELYIGGDGLARGYMNRPELTAETFIDYTSCLQGAFLKNRPLHPQKTFDNKMYKTGDLVRWNYEGYIEFLGRIDTQVKVRGFRIELGEIESRLLSVTGVKETLVLAKEYKSGDRYLCAYVVTKGNESAAELREHISKSLPDYMVPTYYTFLEKMPLTPNGKIDQKSLPEPAARAAGVYMAPRDGVEKRMVKIWSSVLGIEEEKIDIDDNFFELGGHSLKATKLVYLIQKEFEISLDLKDVFANSCIRNLAQIIKAAETQQYVAIKVVEEREYYELSFAQRRL
ncbi:AMP-binding protein, partial [Acidobacteriota bacterium]